MWGGTLGGHWGGGGSGIYFNQLCGGMAYTVLLKIGVKKLKSSVLKNIKCLGRDMERVSFPTRGALTGTAKGDHEIRQKIGNTQSMTR